jgi:hypothetical protein
MSGAQPTEMNDRGLQDSDTLTPGGGSNYHDRVISPWQYAFPQ